MGTTIKQNKTNITSIEQLKEYMQGAIVRLPDFADGQEFYARLKRPSLLGMVKCGKIPNSLLTKTNELFVDSESVGDNMQDEKLLSDMFDIMEIIAGETLVEPTFEELKENGIELTDQQMMFLFSYSQRGVNTLEQFRNE